MAVSLGVCCGVLFGVVTGGEQGGGARKSVSRQHQGVRRHRAR